MKRINKIRIKYVLLVSFFIILATVLPTFMRYQVNVKADVVGYAKETRRSTYKINFHNNGGTGAMDETGSPWPGIVYRLKKGETQHQIGANVNNSKKIEKDLGNNITKVAIKGTLSNLYVEIFL